ncbi:DUF1636 family protein [Halocynthiibacter namhaensis]|uniref:DUF1636 family protein n=1 Tax=Halocynthiibacter namhaensis TaxID=1290553 RepID=UPI0005797FAB|nr:DUF1636 domain-containing protein [Halocynthiibacter namhaensis]
MVGTTLTVCTTCRHADAPEGEIRPGEALFDAIMAGDIPEGVTVKGVKCLSACSNSCTVAVTGGPTRWSYVYGNLDPVEHLDAILDGVGRYARTDDGIVPWRERPEIFKRQSIARIPPQE